MSRYDLGTSLTGLRLLVVDDALDSAESPAPLLRANGAAVRHVSRVDAALEALDTWHPDLLIADLDMPEDASYALIRRVRSLPDHRAALPAIAVTSHLSRDARLRAIRSGFASCASKAFPREHLVNLVGTLAQVDDPLSSPPTGDEEATPRRIRTLDVIIPLYNEEQGAPGFHQELTNIADRLAPQVTIYYVDDGSTDGTASALEAIAGADDRVVVIELSRNFGHQAALSAGLDRSRGDAVITMDGDGQHPPDLVPAMLELLESGHDVVLGQRMEHRQPSAVKRWTSGAFYWLLGRLSATTILPGCSDFRLMSRPVVDAIRQMPERHRFVRGMVAWLGFRSVVLPYAERPRRAGRSKYSFGRMLRLAVDAISSFSLVPLYIALGLGVLFLLLALLEMVYVLSFWVRGQQHRLVPGWSSLMLVILLVGGFVMVAIGIIGSYVGYIFQEVKRRPLYVVRSIHRGQGGQSRDPG